MQISLILLASAFAAASASIISLVPVSYIAHPLPTYNHAQNTLTGEYAYNYAGGPSAKEEIKTIDGVTRGAYSYIDGFGVIQSAQYVADDNGFRVLATNVPTAAQIGVNVPQETPEVQAAKAAHFAEHAKAVAALGRKKRSLSYAAVPTAVSSQYHTQKHESLKIAAPVYQEYVSAPIQTYAHARYEEVVPVAHHTAEISSVPTAVSHQSRSQIHKNAHLEYSYPAVQLLKAVPDQVISYHEALEIPAVAPVAVSSVPTAVSSQSRYQVHDSNKIEVHSPLAAAAVPVATDTDTVVVESVKSADVPVATIAAPVVAASVPTAVSSQSKTQIHKGQRMEQLVEVPNFYGGQVIDSYGHPSVAYAPTLDAWSLATPVAISSQSRTQLHSGHTPEVSSSPTVYGSSNLVSRVPLDTPEVAAAKQAHAKAYAAELLKHQGW
ncbi:uncharacterized protein LOC105689087 [Athalia rosae]|uniref:uncharacterized protein LOC105689087 n=1 Tax=Athalia rosae TaxID=37344 RepID=UPI0020342C75|nr:uncharacterized protein LOC105689087 [Athalia rosae]